MAGDVKKSIREINELIDLVLTLRICQSFHPKSNSRLAKCIAKCRKRYKEKYVRNVCRELARSDNVVADLNVLQRRLLSN